MKINSMDTYQNSDEFYMDLAIKEAGFALKEGLLPVGAIIVANGEVIGKGRRFKEGHPYLDHAEIMAMKSGFGNKTDGPMVTLYSTLEPCLMCFSTILNSRKVERVVFAVGDPYGGGTQLPENVLTPRYKEWWPKIESNVGRQKVLDLMREFFSVTKDPYWQDPENPLRKISLAS